MLGIGTIGVFISVFGFAVIIETPRKYLFQVGIVGAIGGFVYLISEYFGCENVLASFLSAFAIAIVSHAFARILKAPVIIFLIAGILPTVPGAGMYRIVHYIIEGNNSRAGFYFLETLKIAGVIALAIFLADMVFGLFKLIDKSKKA